MDPVKEKSNWDIVLVIVSAFVSAFLAVHLQTQSQHKQNVNNIKVLNCINEFAAGKSLKSMNDKENSKFNWNSRYLTNYYDSVWGDILQEFGTSTLDYVSAINTMNNINTFLTRVDMQNPSLIERQKLYNEVSDGINEVESLFTELGVNEENCAKLFGLR